jgi:S1-C subfamily serine protease
VDVMNPEEANNHHPDPTDDDSAAAEAVCCANPAAAAAHSAAEAVCCVNPAAAAHTDAAEAVCCVNPAADEAHTAGSAAPSPRRWLIAAAARRRHGLGVTAAATAVALVAGVGAGLGITSVSSGSHVTTVSSRSSLAAIESKVDPAIVDIYSTLAYEGGEAAGTGIVLTSTGEVLTNNHVIEGATSIQAVDVGNGRTYSATVAGYDTSADLAVLQLKGASGLATEALGDSSKLAVGQAVVALGNAGGTGGTPSVSTGSITEISAGVSAYDEATGKSESLSGLIGTDVGLQAGDSGGPLVNGSGQVIGLDVAASSGFQFDAGSGLANQTNSYAIPIDEAISVVRQIESGEASSGVHVGATAFLGVEIEPASRATIAGVISGSPAAGAGLAPGDVIMTIDGHAPSSPSSLQDIVASRHPGEQVSVTWSDPSGLRHTAVISLAMGPPA